VTSKVAVHYCKILKDLYIKRQLIVFVSDIMERIGDGEGSDALLSHVLDTAFSLSSSSEEKIVHVKEVVKDAIAQVEKAYENKGILGVPSGIDGLDDVLHGFKPKLYILAGRPGTGKTALATNIAVNAAFKEKKILIFSLEMPNEEVGSRIIASEAKINTQRLENGNILGDDWDRMMSNCGKLVELDLHIDDSADQTDMDIWTKAKRHKAKHGLDMVIIDYLQLVRTTKSMSRREELEEISRNFKKMSKDLSVPVLALAQLSRACEQEKRRPRLSDLREAGGIEQDADVCLFLHYPRSLDKNADENLMEVLIPKHRGGPKGIKNLNWRPDITRFSDWEKNYVDDKGF
jgi:replicative DNA helicase